MKFIRKLNLKLFVTSFGVYGDLIGDFRVIFPEECVGNAFGGRNIRIPIQDYKYLRATVMVVPPWLTHRHTDSF